MSETSETSEAAVVEVLEDDASEGLDVLELAKRIVVAVRLCEPLQPIAALERVHDFIEQCESGEGVLLLPADGARELATDLRTLVGGAS